MNLLTVNNVRFLLTLGLLSLIFPTLSLPNLLGESRLNAGEDIQNETEVSTDLKTGARSKEEELLAKTQEAFRENERLRKEHAKANSNIVTDPEIISGILEERKRNQIKEREEFYKSQKEEPDNPLVDELGTLLPDQEGGYKIDYRFLSEDPFYIPTNVASDIGRYLRGKEYDRVIQYCRKGLNKLQPWSEEYLTLGENQHERLLNGQRCGYYLRGLAVAYELKRDWDAAESLVALAYDTSEGTWARLRIQYAREKDSNATPTGDFEPEDLFFEICMMVKQETYLDVDRVIKSNGEFLALNEEDKRSGLPVPNSYGDYEAVRLYQLREKCARIATPDLYYRKCTLSEDDNDQRAAYRQQVRKSYAEFLRFMEGRYQLVINNPQNWGVAKARAAQVMDYLWKIGKMTY